MTSSSEFDVELFEQRLTNLKDTQEGIQQMSSWCLQQRTHHKKIVSSWLNVLKQVRVEHRLTLFHLANDVIQYSKRKNYEFVESWGTTLQKATTMVRDEKVRNKIFRILKIWEQRGIYSEEYLSDLNGLLSMNPVKKMSQQTTGELGDDFQSSILVANIKDCRRLEQHTDKSFRHLPKEVPNCDAESIKNTLKDRSKTIEVEKELEDYVIALEVYIKNLKAEIKCRNALVTNMDHAETFYANQRGEVKVVVNAYKSFGNRMKVMKKKLDEIAPSLPSPIPSPDINAPSPEPDADIILPDEQSKISTNLFTNMSNGYTSYMDGALPFDINDFKRESLKNAYDGRSNNTQPIEVINSRSEETQSLDFFKPAVSSNSYPTSAPLPVPPVTNYERSQAGINSYSDSYDDTRFNSMDTSYRSDSSYLSNVSRNYDRNIPLMPPPPMPPGLGGQGDEFGSWDLEMSWSAGNRRNSFNHVIDTPVSPPHFEQEGMNTNVIEYVDRNQETVLSSVEDVDHRKLHLPPTVNITLSSGKEKGRSVDIDHRNLISLTGSPRSKTSSNSLKDESLTWSSEDKDLRLNPLPMFPSLTDKSLPFASIDTDYRQPYQNVKDIPLQDTSTTTATSASVPPLEPPNFSSLNDFLSPSNLIDTSMPPPSFSKPELTKTKTTVQPPQKTAANTGNAKGSTGNDDIETIDMEMSDEDLEELVNRDMMEETSETSLLDEFETDRISAIDSTTPAFSTPTQAPFRPPLLRTPDFSSNPHWDVKETRPNVVGDSGTHENVSPTVIWKSSQGPLPPPPRMPSGPGMSPGPPFRMPGNQMFPRGSFLSPPSRGFSPQVNMKPNFRGGLMRPRNSSPFFNSRGRGNGAGVGGMPPSSNPFRNPQNQFRGNFRGNNW